MGSYTLGTQLSTYYCCELSHQLAAVYLDTTTLTSDCLLLLILAATGSTDNFQLCVKGHIVSGCICGVAVN